MKCSRGDVVLVLFPDSNLRTAKRRPALVIQADNLGTGLAQSVVAMITSNMTRLGHPSRVGVSLTTPDGQRSGLKRDRLVDGNDSCGKRVATHAGSLSVVSSAARFPRLLPPENHHLGGLQRVGIIPAFQRRRHQLEGASGGRRGLVPHPFGNHHPARLRR